MGRLTLSRRPLFAAVIVCFLGRRLGGALGQCGSWDPANRRSGVDLGLADARVLVVGGSRGMGRAAVETFAREGARVAVLARASEALDDVVATATALGSPKSVPLAADLTRPS